MDRLAHKRQNKILRKSRIRKRVTGTSDRLRLAVYVSNRNVTAQLINDEQGKTVVYVTSTGQKNAGSAMTEKAAWVGTELAKKAIASKHKKVVLDRGGKLYHGRVNALAEAARKAGLEF
jgi:large subunit ribosomal protein L18